MFCPYTQSLPADTTKIRSVLGGYLYAFEIPPPPPVRPTSRSDSPDEVQRKLKKIKIERERTLSLKGAQAERLKAQRAREKVAKMQQSEEVSKTAAEGEGVMDVEEEREEWDEHDGLAQVSDGEEETPPTKREHFSPQMTAGMEESDGFVFAIHRRTVSVRKKEGERFHVLCFSLQYSIEHYFTRHQKTRLMLFGIPLVVPCVACTTGRQLYSHVWSQVERLIIPDPPPTDQGYVGPWGGSSIQR